ncbi:uncharacterized protein LOC131317402 [Rhododendron vialii]|uniref:uncharacterized protein LOC131317402 n=1 Tax=Rhododendron vialii TaxID=182163 RepID=UPI00265F9F03|nr:uncharacterized protein LOC131317402 [Rhododendron vialii]
MPETGCMGSQMPGSAQESHGSTTWCDAGMTMGCTGSRMLEWRRVINSCWKVVGLASYKMPPKLSNRRGGAGNRGARGRGRGHVEPPNSRVWNVQNPLARDIVAALAAANLLQPPPRDNANSQALVAMREFSHLNPPLFDGASTDPFVANHWLAQIRKNFTALKITEDDLWVSIVVVQLVEEASEWWESILEGRKDARRAARTAAQAEFEDLFASQYFPDPSRDQLRDQFEKLEQGNMTVSEYALRFQSLSRFPPELVATEDRKCRRFERDLHYFVKRLVVAQHKMRYFEGRKRPGESSSATQSQPSVRASTVSSRVRGAHSRPAVTCHRCGQPGHFRVDCRSKECYVCGEFSHLAKDCPRRVRGFRTAGRICAESNYSGKGFAITYAILPPSVTSHAPESAIVRGTFLLFNSFAKVLFDSRASHSFIVASLVCALELKTESLSPPLFVETPVGGRTPLDRICRDYELLIHDCRFTFDFIVLGMSSFDLILGMDWLSMFHATIDCFKH